MMHIERPQPVAEITAPEKGHQTKAQVDPRVHEFDDSRLLVDGRYVREQVGEAVTLFLAPVSGIWRALKGRPRRAKHKRAA
jgi:hypothetical protein